MMDIILLSISALAIIGYGIYQYIFGTSKIDFYMNIFCLCCFIFSVVCVIFKRKMKKKNDEYYENDLLEILYEEDLRKMSEKKLSQLIPMVVDYYLPSDIKIYLSEEEIVENPIATVLLGAIFGDIAGSPFNSSGFPKSKNAEKFILISKAGRYTYNTVLITAIADACSYIVDSSLSYSEQMRYYESKIKEFANKYPNKEYREDFSEWLYNDSKNSNYRSSDNCSAVRASIIGAICDTVEDTIIQSFLSCISTHSHPEGIKGGIVSAVCVWLLLHGARKDDILNYVLEFYSEYSETDSGSFWERTNIDPSITIEDIKDSDIQTKSIDCQNSIPEAIINFINSHSFNDCIRNSFRYQCDTSAIASISGSFASIFYDTDPDWIVSKIEDKIEDFEELNDMLFE